MTAQSIAFFITPHGFGHATRSAAVMDAILLKQRHIRFELFTTCPVWLFDHLPQAHLGYHALKTDIGLVQHSPWREDPGATCRLLDEWLPFNPAFVDQVAAQLAALNCQLVICDISPLGIRAARQAGIPSLLVENFTWDWIYQAYLPHAPALKHHIAYLSNLSNQANHRIQAAPICQPAGNAKKVNPISRLPRSSREQVRQRLNVSPSAKMVLVSTGGVPDTQEFLRDLPEHLDFYMVIPSAHETTAVHPRVILLPSHSEFFHPDLLLAADGLIGKLGYSTVAEAYHIGTPFGFIPRTLFPESPKLQSFIQAQMSNLRITAETYRSGRWVDSVPKLLSLPRTPSTATNGAEEVAAYVQQLLI